jgi:hypothetical protein
LAENYLLVSGLTHSDGTEEFAYQVEFDNFKVTQYAGDQVTLIANPGSTFYVEQEPTA